MFSPPIPRHNARYVDTKGFRFDAAPRQLTAAGIYANPRNMIALFALVVVGPPLPADPSSRFRKRNRLLSCSARFPTTLSVSRLPAKTRDVKRDKVGKIGRFRGLFFFFFFFLIFQTRTFQSLHWIISRVYLGPYTSHGTSAANLKRNLCVSEIRDL